ncbi:zinc metalloproteinase nas-4-like isoform X2 [Ptychodera flava]|uniref:zinc metalloproteinase nas-4-like isoform X2 n=1 Tax=Ptychodera flava TaxID=63121 RepID=UPI00396A994A
MISKLNFLVLELVFLFVCLLYNSVSPQLQPANFLHPWQLNLGACPKFMAKEGMCPKKKKGGPLSDALFGRPRDLLSMFTGAVPIPLKYESPFFEGDIIMTKKKMAEMKSGKKRTGRAIARNSSLLWKGGQVAYQIHRDMSDAGKDAIRQAIKHWEDKTCVRFHKRQPKEKDYIHFIPDYGCWSYVGRRGGKQRLSVGYGCENMGTVAHEIGHALGFWHEQSRLDRNKYVKIHEENMINGAQENFGILSKEESKSRNYAYDYNSIMHYGATFFSRNGQPTIEVTKRGLKANVDMGQRKALSDLDIAQARYLYRCNPKHKEDSTGECFESAKNDGREYRGTLDYTTDGITCQRWTALWPHNHEYFLNNTAKDAKRGVGDHNYCRNPAGKRAKPWCFTTRKDVRWQYCDITVC